jgi:hypothetical protein
MRIGFYNTTSTLHISPIHLKNNTKQNKDKNSNNNEHKRGTTKGEKVPTYGCVSLIAPSWKENMSSWTPNNALIFILNVRNNIQESHK